MAKSLRSKSRRRNVKAKREIYNAKAIEQLKKTLGLTKAAQKIRRAEIMKDLTEMTAAIEASNKNSAAKNSDDIIMIENGKGPDEDEGKLKDGQHPVWKSQRKIKALKKVQKLKKKKQKKIAKAKTKGGKNKK
ncbi:uncharacterized protein LOC143922455 [Arctopsyche grandis]|uniref:uncharacterized protein LOC143922455 n=1 Tax=Arctopsyche grandis TaxID=121162 RepID=UPI00406D893D